MGNLIRDNIDDMRKLKKMKRSRRKMNKHNGPIFEPQDSCRWRVRDPLPPPLICKCGGDVSIKHFNEVYFQDFGSEWPWMYRCDKCGSSVGMHPHTDIPLGPLADKKTRGARRNAKRRFFDVYGSLSRNQAYTKLSEVLGIPKSEAHFGWLNYHQCVLVIRHVVALQTKWDNTAK